MRRNNSRIKAMMVLYNYEITGELIDIEYLNAIIDADGAVPYDDDFSKNSSRACLRTATR